MPIIATVGAANANSFGTQAEALTYFATRLFSTAFTTASSDDQIAALLWACRLMESKIKTPWDMPTFDEFTIRRVSNILPDGECYICWNGLAASETQALSWPRSGMVNKNGFTLASDVIPDQVKFCQFELALLLIQSDRTVENEIATIGLTGIKAGPVELKFKNDIPNLKILPVAVIDMLVASWYFVFVLDPKGVRTVFKVL